VGVSFLKNHLNTKDTTPALAGGAREYTKGENL